MQIKGIKFQSQERNNLNKVFYFDKADNFIRWSDCISIEKEYWTVVFRKIEIPFEIIVTENSEYLPRYGDNIIVILKSNEFLSDIKYVGKVKAVFRNYFSRKYSRQKNVFFLPLPYLGNEQGSQVIPILNREVDIFFAGQADHPLREELSVIIMDIEKSRSDLKIVFQKTQYFFSGLNIDQYLSLLGNSKIALCPAGASVETYRHFESLRHGCVAISTQLPDAWYFKDAPIQIIEKWNDLPSLIDNLIKSQTLMKEISIKSIKYWDNTLSPKSIANYICNSITLLEKNERI